MDDNYKEEYEYEDDEKKFRITRGMVILAAFILIVIIIVVIVIVKKINSKKPEYTLSDFKKLESRMEEESRNYLEQKNIDLDNGDERVDLKDLLEENGGAISKKSVKAAKVCDGYVLATKKETEEYHAYIKCGKYYTTDGYQDVSKKKTTTKKEKDVTKPDIVIIGDEKININVGDNYTDKGATATDNVDGDITNKIVINNTVDTKTSGTYSVTYTVTDKAGNRAEKVRTVIVNEGQTTTVRETTTRNVYTTRSYNNTTRANNTTRKATTKRITTPPTLTLYGNNTIEINAGSIYKDPGYNAVDAQGKNITSKVVVTGSVNTAISGTYTIKYTVTDDYGNKTSKSRIVRVKNNTIKLNSISVTPNSKTLSVGQTYKISVIFNPSNATNKTLIWSSNNSNVASVSNGVVTARKRGVAKITVTPVGSSSKVVEIIVK